MDKNNLLKGLGLGAVAGVIAGILLAPKSGKETRKDIADKYNQIKDDIIDKVKNVKDLTKDKYEDIVESVVDKYKATKKVGESEGGKLKKDLKSAYQKVREALKS